MADAIGLASGVLTLVTSAFTSCQTVYKLLKDFIDAPSHIRSLTKDLEDFFQILGTLQALLEDEETAPGVVRPTVTNNLQSVLDNCILVFNDLSVIVQEFKERWHTERTKDWIHLKWSFKHKSIEELSNTLAAHKITLNLAISVASLYNLRSANATSSKFESEIANYMQELKEKLPMITQQVEDSRAASLPEAPIHNSSDRERIRVDYSFTLRHYFNDAASFMSENALSSKAPSMQISSLGNTTETAYSTAFITARTHLASESGLQTVIEVCSQVFIRHVPGYKSLALQTEVYDTVSDIKEFVRYRIGLDAQFDLSFAGRTLEESRTIEELGIAQDSTLDCISFRPRLSDPGSWRVRLVSVSFVFIDGGSYLVQAATWADAVSQLTKENRYDIKDLYFFQDGRQVHYGVDWPSDASASVLHIDVHVKAHLKRRPTRSVKTRNSRLKTVLFKKWSLSQYPRNTVPTPYQLSPGAVGQHSLRRLVRRIRIPSLSLSAIKNSAAELETVTEEESSSESNVDDNQSQVTSLASATLRPVQIQRQTSTLTLSTGDETDVSNIEAQDTVAKTRALAFFMGPLRSFKHKVFNRPKLDHHN